MGGYNLISIIYNKKELQTLQKIFSLIFQVVQQWCIESKATYNTTKSTFVGFQTQTHLDMTLSTHAPWRNPIFLIIKVSRNNL
jgi:hypothetical protein